MQRTTLIRLCTAFAASITITAAAQAKLLSPWDQRSITLKAGDYACPALPPMPKDINTTSYYSDAQHSVIDPQKQAAYKQAAEVFDKTMTAAEAAADDFQQTGNRGAAECVLHILDTEASASAMLGSMSSNQAYYNQGWTLGALAVAWLKVRTAQPGTPEQRQAALHWIVQVVQQTRDYFAARHDKGTKDGTNNHEYWAGLAVMAAAIADNNPALYDWGKGTFEDGASRITADGTLPLEMERGQRSLHYHAFAITPLVMLAEFGEANGNDLYASHQHAVARLANFTLAGFRDNRNITKMAGVAQDTPGPDGLSSSDVTWLVPYLKRFPDAAAAAMLQGVTIKPYLYLGGFPPGWRAR